ncbi:hypothetical protein BRC2024_HCTLARHO_CDS_0010 [Acinetobacter phage vB_AbaS_Silvergun]
MELQSRRLKDFPHPINANWHIRHGLEVLNLDV